MQELAWRTVQSSSGAALALQGTAMATATSTDETASPTPGSPADTEVKRPSRLRRMGAPALALALLRLLRRVRLLSVLRVLGLARRAVPRPVEGPKAYVQWWQRLLALAALVVFVAGIGLALAAAVGLMVVVAGFLLEQAIA